MNKNSLQSKLSVCCYELCLLRGSCLPMCAASKVTFEDSEKQKIYETISFDKIRAEVDELKVNICLSVSRAQMP